MPWPTMRSFSHVPAKTSHESAPLISVHTGQVHTFEDRAVQKLVLPVAVALAMLPLAKVRLSVGVLRTRRNASTPAAFSAVPKSSHHQLTFIRPACTK
eukprot:scaffold317_cov260-Pinguiococcus_pyrenoidosus.AAC.6